MNFSKDLTAVIVVVFMLNITGTLTAQLTNKSRFKDFSKESKFPFKETDIPQQEYPRLELDDGETVIQLITLQGINVSYIVDYDKYEDQYLTTTDKDEDWYITLIVENTSALDIYYENANDVVAYLNVPGERTFYDDINDKEIKIWGGHCTFYAWMLEKKNGKYVMLKGDDYYHDFIVNRTAESYLEAMVQRRFRPLKVSTRVPIDKKDALGGISDLIAYKATTSSSQIVSLSEGNYQVATLELSRKRVYLTSAYAKISTLHKFKTSGRYTTIYEDNSLRIEIAALNNTGSMEYKVTNLIAQNLTMNNNVPIGELTISNSHVQEIYLAKKNSFAVQKLSANASYTKRFNAFLNPVSGQYWMDNDKLIPRKTFERNYIATNLKLKEIKGAKLVSKSTNASTGGSGKTNVFILFPLNSTGKYQLGKFYFSDAQKHLMHRGQAYKVELTRMGETKWITFDSDFNGFTYPPKKIDKWLGYKPGIMVGNVTAITAGPGESYFFVMIDGKLQSVAEADWKTYMKNSAMTNKPSAEVIKK